MYDMEVRTERITSLRAFALVQAESPTITDKDSKIASGREPTHSASSCASAHKDSAFNKKRSSSKRP